MKNWIRTGKFWRIHQAEPKKVNTILISLLVADCVENWLSSRLDNFTLRLPGKHTI